MWSSTRTSGEPVHSSACVSELFLRKEILYHHTLSLRTALYNFQGVVYRQVSRLFPEEFGVEIVLESVFIEVANRKIGVGIQNDPTLVDFLDFVEIDDV